MSDALYVVRFWDGFDGEWMDVSEPMPKAESEKLAGDKNEARFGGRGKRDGHYGEIDYYAAFPADTKMVFSEGRSQTRPVCIGCGLIEERCSVSCGARLAGCWER